MLVHSLPSFTTGRIREADRVTAPTFRLLDRERVAGPSHGPGSTAALASLHTLLAIQQIELSPQERRRRALRRGQHLLDALAEVQLDLLSGTEPTPALARLRALLAEPALAGDPELDRILEEVELRAEVELAKRERNGGF